MLAVLLPQGSIGISTWTNEGGHVNAMADPLKAGQLFGVDVDHVAGLGPLVPAHSLFGLQVLEATQPLGFEPAANCR